MSFQSVAWAVRQKLPCTQKMVLVMLADRHNSDTGRCDPSHDKLAIDCGLTRRSVIDQLEKLEKTGYIGVNHRAKDGYKTSNQYTLNLNFSPSKDVQDVHNDVNDVHTGCEPVAHIDVNDVPKRSEPVAHKPVSEPVNEPIRETPRKRATPAKPVDVDQLTWDDWTALRAKKRATVSQTVINEARRECAKADLTLERFLQIWCARGSQGLQADWLKQNERSASQPESFRERDTRIARERWEEMTGRIHPENKTNVIDVSSNFLELPQ